jgi:hypothetical protein
MSKRHSKHVNRSRLMSPSPVSRRILDCEVIPTLLPWPCLGSTGCQEGGAQPRGYTASGYDEKL